MRRVASEKTKVNVEAKFLKFRLERNRNSNDVHELP